MTLLPNTSIDATPSITLPVTIGLRRLAPSRKTILALCAITLTCLAAAAALVAGPELQARADQVVEWWRHRPAGLVLGSVVVLMALSAMLALGDRRADADKPIYDIR